MTPEEINKKFIAMADEVCDMKAKQAALMLCHFMGALTVMTATHDGKTSPARLLSALEDAKKFTSNNVID